MPALNYPESISPYIYRNGFDIICEHEMKRKGVGAFAFYEVEQPYGYNSINQEEYNKAMVRSRGNPYIANRYLDRAHQIGFAMIYNGGMISHYKMACKKIRRSRKTKEELFKDFIKNGLPIDPQKFCDPAEMYRPAVW